MPIMARPPDPRECSASPGNVFWPRGFEGARQATAGLASKSGSVEALFGGLGHGLTWSAVARHGGRFQALSSGVLPPVNFERAWASRYLCSARQRRQSRKAQNA